jgi:hypothetical protein
VKATIHQLLRDRLLQRAGLNETAPPRYSLEELQASEWSSEFETLMRNRLIMGASDKPQYDRINSILKRLNVYRQTGNLELLVDAANLCLCEFVEGQHPNRHWHAVDDGEHVTRVNTQS